MRLTISLFFACAFTANVHAQKQLLRYVGTDKSKERISKEFADFWKNRVDIEQQARGYQYYGKDQSWLIPVVVHVVFSDSVKVTAEQINCQIKSLNEDFNGETFKRESEKDLATYSYDEFTLKGRKAMLEVAAGDTGIQFCLADTDDKGKPTTGVNFVYAPGETWSLDDKIKKTKDKGVAAWNPRKYLNIWICALADSVSGGYAQLPGGNWETDGIVIDHRFFGCGATGSKQAPYDKGKTLTHLVGNYLNLFDLWSYEYRCIDDNVSDTPVHNAPNTGCAPARYISTCDGQPMGMVMNFMDNMDDGCLYMFTRGQVQRMQAILSSKGWRSQLGKENGAVKKCDGTALTESMLPEKYWEKQTDPRNKELTDIADLQVAPNPAHDKIMISIGALENGKGRLRVLNEAGRELYNADHSFSRGNTNIEINCNNWPSGVYFILLHNTVGKTLSKMLMVE
jgi:Pregnancy-associated plasma protein-A/Secretion system C-terminal sorting domain